jgi:hypothetical protein
MMGRRKQVASLYHDDRALYRVSFIGSVTDASRVHLCFFQIIKRDDAAGKTLSTAVKARTATIHRIQQSAANGVNDVKSDAANDAENDSPIDSQRGRRSRAAHRLRVCAGQLFAGDLVPLQSQRRSGGASALLSALLSAYRTRW